MIPTDNLVALLELMARGDVAPSTFKRTRRTLEVWARQRIAYLVAAGVSREEALPIDIEIAAYFVIFDSIKSGAAEGGPNQRIRQLKIGKLIMLADRMVDILTRSSSVDGSTSKQKSDQKLG